MEFNESTKAQIVQIQGLQIIKFLAKAMQCGDIRSETTNKIQKMFNILNNNSIDYGIKEIEIN